MPNVHPVRGSVEFVQGSQEAMRRIAADLGAKTTTEVLGEIYGLSHEPMMRALPEIARTRPVGLLAHAPDLVAGGGREALVAALRGADIVVHPYASDTQLRMLVWQHAKTWYAGGQDPVAWITNLAFKELPAGQSYSELAMRVRGPAARTVGDLSRAAIRGNHAAGQLAAVRAASEGVLLNDPTIGVATLSKTLRSLLTDANRTLEIYTKGLDDRGTTHLIAERARRGVDVSLTVRDLAPADAAILEEAGVRTRILPPAAGVPRYRTNVIVSDDRAYAGSAFLWSSMVDEAAPGSREMGLLMDGANARRVRDEVRSIVSAFHDLSITDARRMALLEATS